MGRILFGLILMPTSVLTSWAAARALGLLAARSSSALPFLAGLALCPAVWLAGRAAERRGAGAAGLLAGLQRRVYVFGHELTHALAAWSMGGKLLGFRVGETGGHVDLSHTNAFIALAPYCVPLYTVAVVAGYRAWLWLEPGGAARGTFLVLVGLTLSFHLIKTLEVLWERSQPDLSAAGGVVFSLSWIVLANALILLMLAKLLFPSDVGLLESLRGIGDGTAGFWAAAWAFLRPVKDSFVEQMRR